jgi:multiple sugar transport system substrate-binding protein
MKRFSMIAVAVLVITSMLAAACAAPTPERIVETVVVVETVEVEKMVEGETVTVVETVEVEVVKEVEKEVVVTPTPEPAPEQGMIGGFPTSVQLEADTGQAAFDAADKGEPDPAWAGKSFTIGVYSAGQRGPVSGPLYFWRPKFEELTGATYDIVEIPFAELREKIYTDFVTGAHNYDVIINCSNWYGDAIYNDWIQPVDQYFDDPRMPQWEPDSVAPAVANLMQWGGTPYGGNNDHDAQVLYYRKDIIEDPEWQAAFEAEMGYPMPVELETWEDTLAIAQFFNGKDWNEDGDPDDGITLHLKVGGQGFFHFLALSAPYVVTPASGDDPRQVDRYHNVYFFDPETMEPLINSPGHVRALETLIELSKAGPSAMWGWELGEAWADFLSGNAIMTFSWGDVGSLSQDPAQSVIQGKLGARGIPGTKFPYDMETGEFLELDDPNMVGNQVGCSWHPVLSAFAEDPDLAYYFAAWQSTPEINHWNVATGWTGVDPGTTYDWIEPVGSATVEEYVDGGYNADDAEQFIGAYQNNFFDYPLFVTYLRIPGTPEMSETMDVHLSEAVTGQVTAQEALDRTYDDWVRIIDDIGKEDLLRLYQESIGYTPE